MDEWPPRSRSNQPAENRAARWIPTIDVNRLPRDPKKLALDYYNIQIADRVAFTSRFNLTQSDIDALLAAGVSDATSFTSVRFFTNQQVVKASGVDVVASVPFDNGDGVTNLQLAANFSSIELTRFNPDFTGESRRRRRTGRLCERREPSRMPPSVRRRPGYFNYCWSNSATGLWPSSAII